MHDSSSNACASTDATRVRRAPAPVRLWVLFALVVLALPFGRDVVAAENRVALVDPAPGVLDAIAVALSPWGLRVIPVAGPIPSTDVGTATAAARALARDRNAGAIVWIASPPGAGASLWLYDAQSEQMMVRPLSQAPPFDDAAAAAVALTVKTLLRSTSVAPVKERATGPGPSSPAPSDSTVAPAASASTSASAAPLPSTSGDAGALAPATAPYVPTPTSRHTWRVDAVALAHLPTGTDALVAPRAGLGVSWWPGVWSESVGFGIDARAGTSLDVESPTFTGSFSDTVVGASARARLGYERLSLELAVEPALHVTSLSGAEIGSGRGSSIQRADPAFDVGLIPQVAVGDRLRLGLFLGLDALLRTQRYVLDGDVVLSLPALAFDLGAIASLGLD